MAGYRYVERRDGDADLLNRRLSRREQFFDGLEADPVRSTRTVDRHAFVRNLRRRRPEPGLGKEMLFSLATAKLNQAERFGVGLGKFPGSPTQLVAHGTLMSPARATSFHVLSRRQSHCFRRSS
jgi:hypothetical protein